MQTQPDTIRPGSVVMPTSTIVLIACSSMKRSQPCAALDLYTSPLFTKSRTWTARHLRANGGRWFILSAKYGLVYGERIIEPYDVTLRDLTAAQRDQWAERVVHQLQRATTPTRIVALPTRIVMLAGELYCHGVEPRLRDLGYTVEKPLAGLGIGQRLRWLNLNGGR